LKRKSQKWVTLLDDSGIGFNFLLVRRDGGSNYDVEVEVGGGLARSKKGEILRSSGKRKDEPLISKEGLSSTPRYLLPRTAGKPMIDYQVRG